MSETAVAAATDLRQALCLECGAVRRAKAHYLGRGTRTLRCQSCRRTTRHAAVNWSGLDPREDANAQRSQLDAEARQELEGMLTLFRSCQIDVVCGDTLLNDVAGPVGLWPDEELLAATVAGAPDQPQGGLVDVLRWLQPEGYLVRLQRGLSVADRAYALDWAWKSIRPHIARWPRCVVELDLDGQPFQRIYNNELETGAFTLS